MSWKINILLSIFHILISFFPVGTEKSLVFVFQNFKYYVRFFMNLLRFLRLGREKFKFDAQNFKKRPLFYVESKRSDKTYKHLSELFKHQDKNFKHLLLFYWKWKNSNDDITNMTGNLPKIALLLRKLLITKGHN